MVSTEQPIGTLISVTLLIFYAISSTAFILYFVASVIGRLLGRDSWCCTNAAKSGATYVFAEFYATIASD
jgi:hypothetical protein